MIEARGWVAGYRHGEELLARIEALLRDRAVAPAALGGLVVGTGPGAFTGLRVGIATAKGLAHALRAADRGRRAPARRCSRRHGRSPATARPSCSCSRPGPSDRVAHAGPGRRRGSCRAATEPDLDRGERARGRRPRRPRPGRTPSPLGRAAHDGLAAALLRGGRPAPGGGDADDLARLVPEYVTLPRGVRDRLPPTTAVEVTGGSVVTVDAPVLRIRPMTAADLPAVQLIERASFATPWPAYAFRQELETNKWHGTWSCARGRGRRRVRRHLADGRRGARYDVRGPAVVRRRKGVGARLMLALIELAIEVPRATCSPSRSG